MLPRLLRASGLRRALGRVEDAQEERRELFRKLQNAMKPADLSEEEHQRARLAIQAYQAGSTPQHPLVVNLWCNSRLGGTDLLYSFAQRPHTVVTDEPLCKAFLEYLEEEPPELSQIRKRHPLDPAETIGETIYGPFPPQTKVAVNKNMAKYLSADLPDYGFLGDPHVRNVIVLQRPEDVVRSWLLSTSEFLDSRRSNTFTSANFRPPRLQSTLEEEDLSYADQYCMVHDLKLDRQRPLIVVDHRELVERPRAVLGSLCRALDLEWDERMLRWPAGGHKSLDGPWAGRYYGLLHEHSGFTPEYAAQVKEFLQQPVPSEFDSLIEECQSLYDFFKPHMLPIEGEESRQ